MYPALSVSLIVVGRLLVPPAGNFKLVITLSEPLISTFVFIETSPMINRFEFIETSFTKLLVPWTNNFLLNKTSSPTISLELNETSDLTVSFELKETSPFTNKFAFKEASPKTDILYPVFESTTFLSIEVVSDKL